MKEGKRTDSITLTIDDTSFLYYHTSSYSFFASPYLRTRSTLANSGLANLELENKLGIDETFINTFEFVCLRLWWPWWGAS